MSSSLVPFLEDAVIYGSALSLSELLPGTQAVTSPVLGPDFLGPQGKPLPLSSLWRKLSEVFYSCFQYLLELWLRSLEASSFYFFSFLPIFLLVKSL